MTVLIPYLLKLSISLAIVYLFYQLFLRRLTFYNWNRWYLLIYSAASFFIPFINIYPVLEKNNWDSSGMVELIPVVNYPLSNIPPMTVPNSAIPWTLQDWSLLLLASGAAIMLLRLIIQQISFIRIRRSSTLLLDEKIKVYQVNKNIIPFSYGNSIFVNQHLHSQDELKEIIRHEFIHVKQNHTADIIWGELLCILNWYNPFAWLIRKSIRQNLEFIADNKVLQNGIDKKEYQYLLLKVIGVSHFSVATQFNFSSLKKRIAMMNKIKSAKVHLLKFLFILPLMAVLLLSFRNSFYKNEDKSVYWVSGLIIDETTNLPLKGAVVTEKNSDKRTTTDEQGYFKLPLSFNGSQIEFTMAYDKPGYKSVSRGMRNSQMQFESNNGNIEFVYLAKTAGGQTHSQYFHGEPDYSIIYKQYKEHVAIVERDKKIDALVGNSTKPIWIIDGTPFVVGYGLKAWFNKDEVDASPDFKVSVDGKLMSMDEANATIKRADITGVASSGRETSLRDLGVSQNIFILYLDKNGTGNITDTVPKKWKLPANVSNISITDGLATVKLKNGTVETYNLNNDEELASFEKKYGKVPPPPPPPPVPTTKPGKLPPPPPPPPHPDTREHVRVEPKENSKGYIVSIADNNGECVVIIKDKDKRIVKAMSLSEWNDHEFENAAKYGEIPTPIPPAKAISAVPVPTVKEAKPITSPVKAASPAVPAPGFDQGIIQAPTEGPLPAKPAKPSTNTVKPPVRIRSVLSPNEEILYIIDGVKQPQGDPVLNTIDPNDIESIEILKEGAAKAVYGGENVTGVIIIKTKKSSGKNPIGLDKLDGFEGLIIVDGDEMKKEQLNEKIKTENIESINILRHEEATKLYGDKGKKGVIIIRTKAQRDPVIVSGVNPRPSKSDPGKFAIFKSDKGTLYSNEPFHGIYIIDGNEYSEQQFKALQFDPNTAKTVNSFPKGQRSIDLFGERGKNGVMVISTQETKPRKFVSGKAAEVVNRIVAGIIIDQETRKPIAGVKVYSTELGFETITDKNGYYFVQLNKAATVVPRIFMVHPQYLSAMMFDGSYDKPTEKEHTLVLFMGMHKGDPKNTTQYTTSSMAQQYTLTTNKTPGYEQVNEILREWLNRYDQQQLKAYNQTEKYIDRVKVDDGVMNWTLVKDSKKHPLYLFEKRVIGRDPKEMEKLVSTLDIYEFEIVAHGDLLKSFGDDAKDGIVNFISKGNKDNQNVRLVAKKKISEEELAYMLAEAAKLNVLYVGIENPLKIQVDNIPSDELEVKFESGVVRQRNGVFYAIPSGNTGGNSKVDIYKKNKNGQLQLLNSRYFRVRSLPEQNNFIVSR